MITYPDISSFQAGISLHGADAACCKVTENYDYVNPDYSRAMSNAGKNHVFFFAYHFLHSGNLEAQASWCHEHAGSVPLMVDAEPEGTSAPGLSDILGFVSAYRSLGGTCHLVYLPEWYWSQLGSPSLTPLRDAGLALVSSNYSPLSEGAGWVPYGGVAPVIWQYTDSQAFNGYMCDFNAYRGTLSALESIVRTGTVTGHRHVADGSLSLDEVAASRNTTAAHLVLVSYQHLNAENGLAMAEYLTGRDGASAKMPAGLVYWTTN